MANPVQNQRPTQTPAQTQVTEKKSKAQVKYMRDKDREPVKGIFRFNEVPGGTLSFVFRKYKEDPVERFDMVDGQIYTVPLGVAKHLNTSGWYPVHAYSMDEKGKPAMQIGTKVRRYAFQSLEFTEIDEFPSRQPLIEEAMIIK